MRLSDKVKAVEKNKNYMFKIYHLLMKLISFKF